ncbi:hypothetical protein PIIN_10238 [Serendipita indica DSM 11827]|uniref:Uncharacterized protein n=1 Tax=Serendipita indica (strain DSM 11827) TaxID=1109443 RepID=G4TY53_SERID|nr:hypothetical protein PIIN_10238 [Serendipita indica DSM 11827]
MSGSTDCTVRLWDAAFVEVFSRDGSLSRSNQSGIIFDQNSMASLRAMLSELRIFPLSDDGWVHLSGKLLFWVPPNNRLALAAPLLLTMPTSSPPYPTKIDFTRFECGACWTKVRGGVNQ